jgi:hypothetical protein
MSFIVRDHEGFLLATKSRIKLGNLELVAAMAIAAFYTIEFIRDIFLKCNALQVANAVKSQGQKLEQVWSYY